MITKARIYRPAKTAMQSGRAKTGRWVLEFPPTRKMSPDPLMGWNSGDTLQQIRLEFETRDAAIAYAREKNISFEMVPPKQRITQPKSYAANFAYNRRTAFSE